MGCRKSAPCEKWPNGVPTRALQPSGSPHAPRPSPSSTTPPTSERWLIGAAEGADPGRERRSLQVVYRTWSAPQAWW